MKLLWLGSSNDRSGYLAEEDRPPFHAKKELEKALGVDVEVVVRQAWPTEQFPALVESWMERYEPELVMLKVSTYSFTYESVPLKIQRLLGPLGKPLARAGLKAADTGWLSSRALFHEGRKLAQRTIGGDPNFDPDDVLERMSACIRTILRNERTALLVRGPRGGSDHYVNERVRLRAEARRRVVHQGLDELCSELHVTFAGASKPRYETNTRTRERLGDRLHSAASETPRLARDMMPGLLTAWAQLHSEYAAESSDAAPASESPD